MNTQDTLDAIADAEENDKETAASLWPVSNLATSYTAPDGTIWKDQAEYAYSLAKIGLLDGEEGHWHDLAADRDWNPPENTGDGIEPPPEVIYTNEDWRLVFVGENNYEWQHEQSDLHGGSHWVACVEFSSPNAVIAEKIAEELWTGRDFDELGLTIWQDTSFRLRQICGVYYLEQDQGRGRGWQCWETIEIFAAPNDAISQKISAMLMKEAA